MRQKVELYIEELVLEGFSATDRYEIGEAVKRELMRLLEVRGVPGSLSSNRNADKINGGSFELASRSRTEKIAKRVAEAVYRGLKM